TVPSALIPTTRTRAVPALGRSVVLMARNAIVRSTIARCPNRNVVGNGSETGRGESGKPVRVRHRPAAVSRALEGDSTSPKTGLATEPQPWRASGSLDARRAYARDASEHRHPLSLLCRRRLPARGVGRHGPRAHPD